jgi:hypothetical protein
LEIVSESGNAASYFEVGLSLIRQLVINRDIFLRMNIMKRTSFKKDARRKHHHWQVTLIYRDGERFSRTYTVHAKATGFAERQKKSPVVKMARVTQVS